MEKGPSRDAAPPFEADGPAHVNLKRSQFDLIFAGARH